MQYRKHIVRQNFIYKNVILCYFFIRDVNSLMFYFKLIFLSFIFIESRLLFKIFYAIIISPRLSLSFHFQSSNQFFLETPSNIDHPEISVVSPNDPKLVQIIWSLAFCIHDHTNLIAYISSSPLRDSQPSSPRTIPNLSRSSGLQHSAYMTIPI